MDYFAYQPDESVSPAVASSAYGEHHVHIINPFWDAAGGSEWEALTLYEELKPHCKVSLWSEFNPDPRLLEKYPIAQINETGFPKKGLFVFVGTYFSIGTWIYFTWPKRVVLVHNVPLKGLFVQTMHRMAVFDLKKVDVVYASKWLADVANYPGKVGGSPINIQQFVPPDLDSAPGAATDDFVVGRLSRDAVYKHHANDPAFYRHLTQQGFQIKIMGGTCLAEELSHIERVTLLPNCSEEPQTFLQSLDCFFYRTSEKWTEPLGRVVFEAMACGLPVVAENRGGYTELIEHGRNGFLFHSEQEALDSLLRLRNDRHLCRSIGKAARETIEEHFSPARRQEMIQFYLR